jgi:hypothetical protein
MLSGGVIAIEGAYKLAQLIFSTEMGITNTEKQIDVGCIKKGAIAAPLQIFFKMAFTSLSPGS